MVRRVLPDFHTDSNCRVTSDPSAGSLRLTRVRVVAIAEGVLTNRAARGGAVGPTGLGNCGPNLCRLSRQSSKTHPAPHDLRSQDMTPANPGNECATACKAAGMPDAPPVIYPATRAVEHPKGLRRRAPSRGQSHCLTRRSLQGVHWNELCQADIGNIALVLADSTLRDAIPSVSANTGACLRSCLRTTVLFSLHSKSGISAARPSVKETGKDESAEICVYIYIALDIKLTLVPGQHRIAVGVRVKRQERSSFLFC